MYVSMIPAGLDDFKELITKDYYYIDKTGMVKELLDDKAKIHIFSRPHRFGNTLALSMLRYFFEIPKGCYDTLELFRALTIYREAGEYLEKQGKYPVIFLSLNASASFSMSQFSKALAETIRGEYLRLQDVLLGFLPVQKKIRYVKFMKECWDIAECTDAVYFLMQCLFDHHQEKVVLLVDGCDFQISVENAPDYEKGTADALREMFSRALVENPYLERAVIMESLWINQESLFAGVAGCKYHTIFGHSFRSSFGFTKKEVQKLLTAFELEEKEALLWQWYGGYSFGGEPIYNPWSVMNMAEAMLISRETLPTPDWDYDTLPVLLRELRRLGGEAVDYEVNQLLAGGTVRKAALAPFEGSFYASEDVLWNVLLWKGFLKVLGTQQEKEDTFLTLGIPNEEVHSIYRYTSCTTVATLSPLEGQHSWDWLWTSQSRSDADKGNYKGLGFLFRLGGIDLIRQSKKSSCQIQPHLL